MKERLIKGKLLNWWVYKMESDVYIGGESAVTSLSGHVGICSDPCISEAVHHMHDSITLT